MRKPRLFAHDPKGILPRMSWSPHNLYNLLSRSLVPLNRAQTSFRDTADTMYQQRWRSKRFLRAYHGDWIPERRFKRWFLPTSLPSLLQKRQSALSASSSQAGGQQQREASAEERMPVASLFMRDVERRVDTTLFRACFARSAYEARGLVVQGHVQVNGAKVTNPNHLLQPGDLVSVTPAAIPMLNPALAPHLIAAGGSSAYGDVPVAPESTAADPAKREPESAAAEVKREISSRVAPPLPKGVLPFTLPAYAAPHLFVPGHLEVSFATCSLIFLREPTILTARGGRGADERAEAPAESRFHSDLASPYAAGGDLFALAWEHYARAAPRMRAEVRREREEARTKRNGFESERAQGRWSLRRAMRRGVLRSLLGGESMPGKTSHRSVSGTQS